MTGFILKEIFLRRGLIWELALKDLKVRYRRPILGAFWAFLLPALTTLIFFIIFSLMLKVKIEGPPFVLYVMVAVFSWSFFQSSVLASVTCLLDNKNLIKEANFPHYLIPVSIVAANMINFSPALLIALVISVFVLKGFSFFIFLLPVIIGIHIVATAGLSIIVATYYPKWRDIKYIMEAALLALFYFTPVFYPISLLKEILPGFLYSVYIYSPLAGILSLYRVALLKGFYSALNNEFNISFAIIVSFIFAVIIFLSAAFLYGKNKESINDHLSY